mmetsp:Transcript_7371/g.22526  ORF Transcript_7371/g.22526 Transcript_7371/m.22526 type:complete len:97 (-) Transcript_7371:509-799(-)
MRSKRSSTMQNAMCNTHPGGDAGGRQVVSGKRTMAGLQALGPGFDSRDSNFSRFSNPPSSEPAMYRSSLPAGLSPKCASSASESLRQRSAAVRWQG